MDFDGNFITIVHASFSPVTIKLLWKQLGLGFTFIPWLNIGDFNCILRLDKKKGGMIPKVVCINEFRS